MRDYILELIMKQLKYGEPLDDAELKFARKELKTLSRILSDINSDEYRLMQRDITSNLNKIESYIAARKGHKDAIKGHKKLKFL